MTLTQGLRIELTAYENNTQVDSTSLEVQILDDPSEQQNPLPDHDLLRRIAESVRRQGPGGGEGSVGDDRAAAADRRASRDQDRHPPGAAGGCSSLLIALLTIEWVWRRRLGLA